jgi:hypothetical protein
LEDKVIDGVTYNRLSTTGSKLGGGNTYKIILSKNLEEK